MWHIFHIKQQCCSAHSMGAQTRALVQYISDLSIILHLVHAWGWLSLTPLCSCACDFVLQLPIKARQCSRKDAHFPTWRQKRRLHSTSLSLHFITNQLSFVTYSNTPFFLINITKNCSFIPCRHLTWGLISTSILTSYTKIIIHRAFSWNPL